MIFYRDLRCFSGTSPMEPWRACCRRPVSPEKMPLQVQGLPYLEGDPCTCAKPVGEHVHEQVVVLSRAATVSSLQFCDIVSKGLDLGGVASETGLKEATDNLFETCHWGFELALNGDLELEVGEAQPVAGRVG